jgi:hypothetical protein
MSEQAQAQSRLSWGQFSLRSMMMFVTVLCVLLALMVVPPLLALVIAAMYIGLTGFLVIGIWEGAVGFVLFVSVPLSPTCADTPYRWRVGVLSI